LTRKTTQFVEGGSTCRRARHGRGRAKRRSRGLSRGAVAVVSVGSVFPASTMSSNSRARCIL
jgi:hypothetical protein